MKQARMVVIVITIFILLQSSTHTNEQSPNLWEKYCAPTSVLPGSETAFALNLASAFSGITTMAGQGQLDGFMSYGSVPAEYAHALYYCRGQGSGITAAQCQGCVADTQLQLSACTTRTEAIVWYQECTVHVANRDMRGVLQTQPSYLVWSLETLIILDRTQDFSGPTRTLAFNVIDQTAQDTKQGYADGYVQLTPAANYYFMAQCSADLIATGGPQFCISCLHTDLQSVQLNENMALNNSKLLGGLLPSCQLLLGIVPIDASSPGSAPPPSIPNLVKPADAPVTAPTPGLAPIVAPPVDGPVASAPADDAPVTEPTPGLAPIVAPPVSGPVASAPADDALVMAPTPGMAPIIAPPADGPVASAPAA